MQLVFINPNSTAAMTELIAREARAVARPTTRVVARNPAGSPPAIEGSEDGAAAVPHVVAELRTALGAGPVDAAVVACFDDTGLPELRQQFALPVFGIGECAFHLAMLRAPRFAVVTTLPISVPVIEQNLLTYGFASRCARVYAANVGVLEIERKPAVALRKLSSRLEQARDEDGVGAIVLGCAGMADIAVRLEQRYGLPVIDGVKAAVALAESVVRLAPASHG
ncbi:MAG: aspartate/glutamate racemase family protein [Pseudomonadota bacterium]